MVCKAASHSELVHCRTVFSHFCLELLFVAPLFYEVDFAFSYIFVSLFCAVLYNFYNTIHSLKTMLLQIFRYGVGTTMVIFQFCILYYFGKCMSCILYVSYTQSL